MSDKLWQELGWGIYCVDAEYIRPGLVCCYLMVQDGEVAIIETGTSHTAPTIAALLAEIGLAVESVRYIIPTHVHLDHAGGAGALMEQYPNAELVIHPRGARHMISPEKLVEGTIAVYGEEKFAKLYGDIPAIAEERVIIAEDGFTVNLNGRQLAIRDTPGHADHHFCVWDDLSKGWFSGDTFGISYDELVFASGRYIFPTTTPVQFDPQKLLLSIDMMMSYEPERVFLTHYGMVEEPQTLAGQLKEQVVAYSEIAVEQEGVENEVDAIAEKLSELILARITAIQPDCDTIAMHQLLTMDFNLNAQGLSVWLQRRKG